MLNEEIIALAKQIKNKIQHGITISTAESCTGGMLATYLTSVSGSSEYFGTGIVSYSNEAKIKLLSVTVDTLDKFGAVSEEVAKEMATGCKNIAKSDIAISITGIAGPDGGTKFKPVGTVCFGIANKSGINTITCHFQGDRSAIRQQACKTALGLILDYISSNNAK